MSLFDSVLYTIYVFLIFILFVIGINMSFGAESPTCEQKLAACDKCVVGCTQALKDMEQQAQLELSNAIHYQEELEKCKDKNTELQKELQHEIDTEPSRFTWFFIGVGTTTFLFTGLAFLYIFI